MITAAIAFWDEPISNLTRILLSLEGVAANAVILDGRWNLMPGDNTNSPEEQHQAIATTCDQIGLPYGLYLTHEPFDTQVSKRSALMHLAHTIGHQPWTLVIDGDEHITQANPPDLHRQLAHSQHDVATVTGTKYGNGMRTGSRPIRRIYRTSSRVTVKIAHNGYCTPDGKWLHGDSAFVTLEPTEDCSPHLTISNQVGSRGNSRNQAAQKYRQARVDHRVERWPRGLKT